MHISVDKSHLLMHTLVMSNHLINKIKQFAIKDEHMMAKLAMVVGKHQGTVERWVNAGRIPMAKDRYKVALALGCSEDEALALADEELSQAAM